MHKPNQWGFVGQETRLVRTCLRPWDEIASDTLNLRTITAASKLIIEIYCKHKSSSGDHLVAKSSEVDIIPLLTQPTKDLELPLTDPKTTRETGTLIIQVAIANIWNETGITPDTTTSSPSWPVIQALDHTGIIVEMLRKKDIRLSPRWMTIITSLEALVQSTKRMGEVCLFTV